MKKSLRTDSAGRLNLGKEFASQLFSIYMQGGKFVLEPARIMTEREIEEEKRILLSPEEWRLFEKYMNEDTEPNNALKQLMRDEN